MQPKSLLILTLVAFGLGAFIFFYEKDLPSTDERTELAKKVLKLEAEAIDSILIEWGEQTVRLERQGAISDGSETDTPSTAANATAAESTGGNTTAAWRLTAPFEARADRTNVDSLLSSLTELESQRDLEDIDRAALGLDEPRARVTLGTEEGQHSLEIGAELPASDDMLVALDGSTTAHRVSATLFETLTRDLDDWRDKRLVTASRGEIDRVSLSSNRGTLVLARRGDNFWIESPLSDRADEELVNSLMSEITGLRVEKFLDDIPFALEELGLDPPTGGLLEVVLAGRDQPFRFELGEASGEGEGVTYGRADGQLFEIKTKLGSSLDADLSTWRSKAWTPTQVFKIESARFEDAAGTNSADSLAVTREGADWLRDDDRIAYSVVSDLLYPIAEARGEEIVDRETAISRGYTLESPQLTVVLGTKDGEEELALFSVVEGLAAATAYGRDAILLIKEDQVTEIRGKLQELRNAEPLPATDTEGAEETESKNG